MSAMEQFDKLALCSSWLERNELLSKETFVYEMERDMSDAVAKRCSISDMDEKYIIFDLAIRLNKHDNPAFVYLIQSCLYKMDRTVDTCLNKKIDVNQTDIWGLTPLLWSVLPNKNQKVVNRLLQEEDIDVNITDRMGRTPLIMSVKMQNFKVAELLLAVPETNLFARDRHGNTAFVYAHYSEISKVLSYFKADTKRVSHIVCSISYTWAGLVSALTRSQGSEAWLEKLHDISKSYIKKTTEDCTQRVRKGAPLLWACHPENCYLQDNLLQGSVFTIESSGTENLVLCCFLSNAGSMSRYSSCHNIANKPVSNCLLRQMVYI